jgi:hypothetical protein
MKRLFTFGCSFTQYWRWPTWADALGQQYDFYENWGMCGAGNSLIFYSLIECHQRNTITKDDDVFIMWTNTSREDRYIRDRWQAAGNVYWTAGNALPAEYILNFTCERGYLIRDLATVTAARHILDHIGCRYTFFSMVPFLQTNESVGLASNPNDVLTEDSDVRELYADTISIVKPSVYDTVFCGDWQSRPGILDHNTKRRDFHPTPMEHLEYLRNIEPELVVEKSTVDWMQSWQNLAESGNNQWELSEQWKHLPKRL